MAHLEDDEDAEWFAKRAPGRFRVSIPFPEGGAARAAEVDDDVELPILRFAYQKITEDGEILVDSSGLQLVLRDTPTHQQLKALFAEDTREIRYLAFQRFNRDGKRLAKESVLLTGHEIVQLRNFLSLIASQSLELAEGEGIKLRANEIEALLADESSREDVYRRYRGAFKDLFESDVEAPEIVSYARRRREIDRFERLLRDEVYFEAGRSRLRSERRRSGPEDVWQHFFEQNQWIFGTGVVPQFVSAWDPNKLERAVVGPSIFGAGKRPDAVMRTMGALSALVFVEIKRHDADLLERDPYRSGVWVPGSDVVGGVAQCQMTVDEVVRQARALPVTDEDGFQVDQVLVCRPRSILVVGSLEAFVRDGQPHVERFESFERYRRSLADPEIVTYDELFQRASMALSLARPTESDK